MKSMLEKDSWNASPRESTFTGEPLSVVGICLDDETWRFLNLFAGLTPSIRVRSRVASYRSDQDQDAILEQLGNAVVRLGSRRKEKRDQSHAQLLAFMGAKGGCGTTTMATQLGALLAGSFSRKALLLDLHPDFGDAALYLKLTKTRYHFFELLENTDRMDADFLESFLMRHSSGLELIPAPEGSVGTRGALPPGALSNTLDFLRPRYEFILVDLPPALNDENLAVLRDCDQLYLVTVAEVSAVRNVVRQLEYFS